MKKLGAILIVIMMLFVSIGCGDTKVINGVEYGTYGLLNREDNRNPDIKYRLIIGNIVWSCILVGTIIAPIYFLGFDLYKPIDKIDPKAPKGAL